MKVRGADEAVRRWLALTQSLSSPSAWDPIAIRGRRRALRCSKCRGLRWIETVGKRTGRVERCASCGEPWDSWLADEPKRRLRKRERHHSDSRSDALAEQATLTLMIERLRLWDRRAYLLYLVGGYDWALAQLRSRWPRAVGGWSERRVKRHVRAARDDLERMLNRAGWLDTEGRP